MNATAAPSFGLSRGAEQTSLVMRAAFTDVPPEGGLPTGPAPALVSRADCVRLGEHAVLGHDTGFGINHFGVRAKGAGHIVGDDLEAPPLSPEDDGEAGFPMGVRGGRSCLG